MPGPSVQLPAPAHGPTVEVNSRTVVPLQTKCHQYWPDPPDVVEHGNFHIRCQSEDCTIAYVFRDMLVTNTQVSSAPGWAWPGEGGAQRPALSQRPLRSLHRCPSRSAARSHPVSTNEHLSKGRAHVPLITVHSSQHVGPAHVHVGVNG